MAIPLKLLRELSDKEAAGPFVFLVELLDKDNGLVRRFTNYEKGLTFRNNLYQNFPFVYSIPEFSKEIGQSVQITFGNFEVNAYNGIKDDLKKTNQIQVFFIDVNDLDNELFPKASYYFGEGDTFIQDDTSVRMTFSRKLIVDKKFPFRRYNSDDHPVLYEDFPDVSFR